MLRAAAFLLAGLVAGGVVATWWGGDGPGIATPVGADPSLERRVVELERELAGETARRGALQQRLFELEEAVAMLGGAVSPDPGAAAFDEPPARRAGAGEPARERGDDDAPRPPGFRDRFADAEDRRLARLVDAGFSAERAQWLEQRTSQLRMEALQAQYDAARGGEGIVPGRVLDADQALRAEIGDLEYERYLEALNRSTSIGIRDVLASSPAEQAGLRPGDEIIAYSGRRVFAMSELNALTLEGQPGETVAIDVLRDGQQIQLYVPRGPIGITGGGRFGRRP